MYNDGLVILRKYTPSIIYLVHSQGKKIKDRRERERKKERKKESYFMHDSGHKYINKQTNKHTQG